MQPRYRAATSVGPATDRVMTLGGEHSSDIRR